MSSLVIAAAGIVLVTLALVDLFLTVFNYDGFTFVAGRFQRLLWRFLRGFTRPLPERARHAALSLGSAAMLPATVAYWLAIEVAGFALIYEHGLDTHSFDITQRLAPGIGSAFYLSAGAISSLTFGDLIGRTAVYQAALVTETIFGLATFTLALGYVVTTFGVLSNLDALHNTVRRHAPDPARPSSILSRHFRGGQPSELSDLLQSLSGSLEAYDEGLRRYPVVYYFHTRRVSRSIPRVFWSLGELLAQLRWGLPPDVAIVDDPWLAALLSQYSTTMDRLRRSFVGPDPMEEADPVDAVSFAAAYSARSGQPLPDDAWVASFISTQERARAAAGLAAPPDDDIGHAYERYREWLGFAWHRSAVLERIADRLGYPLEEVTDTAVG